MGGSTELSTISLNVSPQGHPPPVTTESCDVVAWGQGMVTGDGGPQCSGRPEARGWAEFLL